MNQAAEVVGAQPRGNKVGRQYGVLKAQVKQEALLEKQPLYYTIRILFNLSLLALSIYFLWAVDNFALQLLNAGFLAFVYGQIAFVGHNSGHRQVGQTAWQDEVLNLSHFGLLLGLSRSWWVDKHNEHHGNPNVLDMDPDIDFPVLVFTEEQALEKRGIFRFIVAYQAWFFPLLTSFVPYNMRVHSVLKLLRGEAKYPRTEALLMVVHFVLYFGLLFTWLPAWQAIVFAVTHQALVGWYMAAVFAVNHKGMPVLEKDHDLDFLRLQVLTSRNIRSHPLIDFFYGGLNYQIEHHLFPTMPQNKLRRARELTMAYCQEQGIPYHETGFVEGLVEVLQHLHHVSAVLRARKPTAFTAS
jgi:fatty acid desaturase